MLKCNYIVYRIMVAVGTRHAAGQFVPGYDMDCRTKRDSDA